MSEIDIPDGGPSDVQSMVYDLRKSDEKIAAKDAEIKRLRRGLETIASDRLPGGNGPAAFACEILDGKETPA